MDIPALALTAGPLSLIGVLLSIIIGIIFCFFGYRIFKVVLGIAGFIWGALLVGLLVFRFTNSTLAGILSGIAGGILFAVLAVVLYYVGVFILGAYLGGVVGVFILAILGAPNLLWVVVVLALLGGVLAVIFQKFMVVLSTAFVGAWGIIMGTSYLITLGPWAYPYLPLALWLVLGVTGTIIQYKVTAKKKLQEERPKDKR